MKYALLLVLSSTLLSLGVEPRADTGPVPYPEGYRSWQHVKSAVLLDDHPLADQFGGIHHIYANPPALEGLRDGSFPNGAVFVFDLLEAAMDQGAVFEGARKRIDVMHRDLAEFGATGGWGFESFAGESPSERLVTDPEASCFACHTSRAETSFVFTEWRP